MVAVGVRQVHRAVADRRLTGRTPARSGSPVVFVAGPGPAPLSVANGVVFQDHALFPHLDVAGNVAFGLDGAPGRGTPGAGPHGPGAGEPGRPGRALPARALRRGAAAGRAGSARWRPSRRCSCLDEPFAHSSTVGCATRSGRRPSPSCAAPWDHGRAGHPRPGRGPGRRRRCCVPGGGVAGGTPPEVFHTLRNRFVATSPRGRPISPARRRRRRDRGGRGGRRRPGDAASARRLRCGRPWTATPSS
ncbi:hypothetical protein HBB16_16130 [Pseudonocardia sp. MCCB 268]|nr:hypothetical protein [Pseudonocardia cytotoxica]